MIFEYIETLKWLTLFTTLKDAKNMSGILMACHWLAGNVHQAYHNQSNWWLLLNLPAW